VTEKIAAVKLKKGLTWAQIAMLSNRVRTGGERGARTTS
jgi:hypothetical protein